MQDVVQILAVFQSNLAKRLTQQEKVHVTVYKAWKDCLSVEILGIDNILCLDLFCDVLLCTDGLNDAVFDIHALCKGGLVCQAGDSPGEDLAINE
ncbi:hypothetical protein HG531_012447 [Fusarium graminearum]|nr:hypothetical protein HG531_012447 [Fusarium graminearum]